MYSCYKKIELNKPEHLVKYKSISLQLYIYQYRHYWTERGTKRLIGRALNCVKWCRSFISAGCVLNAWYSQVKFWGSEDPPPSSQTPDKTGSRADTTLYKTPCAAQDDSCWLSCFGRTALLHWGMETLRVLWILGCACIASALGSRLKTPALPIQPETEPMISKGLSGKRYNQ